MKRPPLYLLPLALFGFIAFAFYISLQHGGMGGGEGGNKFALHVNEPAPVTTLPLLSDKAGDKSGKNFSTADWRGHPYVVNFFASWCVACRAEHPGLMLLGRHSIPVVGIAFKDKAAATTALLNKQGNPYTNVARDDDGRAGIDWALTGVPETFIIDKDGIIRFHLAGPLTPEIMEHDFIPVWRSVSVTEEPENASGNRGGGE